MLIDIYLTGWIFFIESSFIRNILRLYYMILLLRGPFNFWFWGTFFILQVLSDNANTHVKLYFRMCFQYGFCLSFMKILVVAKWRFWACFQNLPLELSRFYTWIFMSVATNWRWLFFSYNFIFEIFTIFERKHKIELYFDFWAL